MWAEKSVPPNIIKFTYFGIEESIDERVQNKGNRSETP